MLVLDADGFDWDEGNYQKCQKHGVSIEDIEQFFVNDPDLCADPAHSLEEQRLRAIGKTTAGRFLFVVFTMRRSGPLHLIRPLSARYMHEKEVRHYEQQRRP